ncbi:hypothetical protein JT366_08525 [Sphingomonas paucimobilis]|uniref:hypothetical protein n=1 Tax=Sphingomonas paucimobilis TaxID=13689 RepID=UPI001964B3DD|nr:hypothetical protein [Sphingomonas paucimobilis]QRY97249.1 hypothetical protein JT366_08525 [Sphingomonas paucimobilis]
MTKANTPVFTVGGKTFKLRSYELNLGVDVQPRMLANDESILIVDRAESLTATVEAVPYAEFNPYDVAMKGLRQEIVIQHGKTAGKIVTITTPTSTLRRPPASRTSRAWWNGRSPSIRCRTPATTSSRSS